MLIIWLMLNIYLAQFWGEWLMVLIFMSPHKMHVLLECWESKHTVVSFVEWLELRTNHLVGCPLDHTTGDLDDQSMQTLVVHWAQVEMSNTSLDGCWVGHSHVHSFLVFHEETWDKLCQVWKGFTFNQFLLLVRYFQKEKEKPQSCDHMITLLGGGMQAKASKIVILCYFLSISYLINYCKNIQNIKNCLLMPAPPSGGGVWCDTPVSTVRTTHQMACLYIINTEVPAPGNSLSWDTNLFVCEITTLLRFPGAVGTLVRNSEKWKLGKVRNSESYEGDPNAATPSHANIRIIVRVDNQHNRCPNF